jgi:uncharacterized protein
MDGGYRAGLSVVLAATLLACTQAPPAELRSVTVSGSGELSVRPDRAQLSMHVDVLADEVAAGEQQVNRAVRAFLEQARALGARDQDLRTTGVSIQPEYRWDERRRRQELAGYRVRRHIEVTVTDLEQLGAFIAHATASGVNHVAPPRLESSRAAELQLEALALAAADARTRAERLAQTLNLRLGAARRIDAVDGGEPPPLKAMAMRAEAFADTGADMGLETGEIVYRAGVSAQFDLVEGR